jgi:hypothetical protein
MLEAFDEMLEQRRVVALLSSSGMSPWGEKHSEGPERPWYLSEDDDDIRVHYFGMEWSF